MFECVDSLSPPTALISHRTHLMFLTYALALILSRLPRSSQSLDSPVRLACPKPCALDFMGYTEEEDLFQRTMLKRSGDNPNGWGNGEKL